MKKKELTHYLLDSMVGTRYTLESLQERLNCVSDEKVEIVVVDEEELILAEDFRIDFETDMGKTGSIWYLKTRTGNIYVTEIALLD